jgi:hypothetical protein
MARLLDDDDDDNDHDDCSDDVDDDQDDDDDDQDDDRDDDDPCLGTHVLCAAFYDCCPFPMVDVSLI